MRQLLVCAVCSGALVFLKAKCNASLRKHGKSSQNKMGMDDTDFNWTAALNCSHSDISWKRKKAVPNVGTKPMVAQLHCGRQ